MKELAKASETEKPISSDKKTTVQVSELLFFEEIQPISISKSSFFTKEKVNKSYSNLYFYGDSDTVFRPPIFIS
jgi:hypothetical protein